MLIGLGAAGLAAAAPAFTGVARADVEIWVDINGNDYKTQGDWAWCRKCSGLFWSSNGLNTGVCPAGGAHDLSGSSEYWVPHDGPEEGNPASDPYGVQQHWSWCKNCDVLFWGPGDSGSYCPNPPAGKHNHVAGSSTVYDMMFGGPFQGDLFYQDGWAWCSACQGLFWSGFGGKCPGTNNMAEAHTVGSGTDYDLLWGANP